MIAYKCDCCKEYIDEAFPIYLAGFTTPKGDWVGTVEGHSAGKIDVCESCLVKIEETIDKLLTKI